MNSAVSPAVNSVVASMACGYCWAPTGTNSVVMSAVVVTVTFTGLPTRRVRAAVKVTSASIRRVRVS